MPMVPGGPEPADGETIATYTNNTTWHECLSACSAVLASTCSPESMAKAGFGGDANLLPVNPEYCCPRGSVHGTVRENVGGLCVVKPLFEPNPLDGVYKASSEGKEGEEGVAGSLSTPPHIKNNCNEAAGAVHDPTTNTCKPLPLHPLFDAIRAWDAAEVWRLVGLNEEGTGDAVIDPLRLMPSYWNARGETALMMAARLGSPAVVTALLFHPGIRRTINVANVERTYKIGAGTTYVPSALHYAVVGAYEATSGIAADWFSTRDPQTSLKPRAENPNNEPKIGAPPKSDDINHADVIQTLLGGGASPFAGTSGGTVLHMAFEIGMVDAATEMLRVANCAALAYATTAHLDPSAGHVNLLHAASGAMMPTMMTTCREMLAAHANNADVGTYKMYGLTIEKAPSIKQGICSRAEVYDPYFIRSAAQVEALVKFGYDRCGVDSAFRINGVSEAAFAALPFPAMMSQIMVCDYRTAKKLLKYGANPFASDPTFGPLFHLAAQRGCHQIVEEFLATANQNSTVEMVRLSLLPDNHERTAKNVSLDTLSMCYIRMAQRGVPPIDSECATSVKLKALLDGFSKTSDASSEVEAAAAVMEALTSTPSTAVKLTVGDMGWREYKGKAPLLHGMPNNGNSCDIVQIDGLVNAAEFYRQFQLISRPVVFVGGASEWPATSKWTPEYLSSIVGEDRVRVSGIPYQSAVGTDARSSGTELSMSDFLSNMLKSGPTNLTGPPPPYLFDNKLLSEGDKLIGDYITMTTLAESDILDFHLLVGPEGSGAPAHFHTGAVNALLFGRKRWFLYPPSAAFWSKKAALPWLMDGDGIGEPIECVQQPGDIMFVPATWGHAVLNVEDTVAVTMTLNDVSLKNKG
jgi:hypothetical protein